MGTRNVFQLDHSRYLGYNRDPRGRVMIKKHSKLQILILLGIAVTTTIFLAAGLSRLKLLPGQPFVPFIFGRDPIDMGYDGLLLGEDFLIAATRAIIILFALLVPVVIILSIIYPDFRKRMLRRLISLILFFLCLYVLLRLRPDILSPAGETLPLDQQALPGAVMPQDPATESMAAPPQWLTPAVSLCIALPVTALLVGLTTRLILHRRQHLSSPLVQLAQEAEDAIEQLQAGADLKNTVIRCYAEMTRVLAEQRGIERRRNMTTREFEAHLRALKLPDEPVKRLTRLFEDVRYGTKVPGKLEERQAITSLTAIVEASKRSIQR